MAFGDGAKNSMSQGRLPKPIMCNITEEQFYVHPKNKEDLDQLVCTWSNIGNFGEEMGSRAAILSGPPGTGKTMGVQYLATRLKLPLYTVPLVLDPMFIQALFNELREAGKKQPSIVFFDEMDGFNKREEIVDPTQRLALNTFLGELNGTTPNKGLYFVGATNHINDVDSALRRPGRFETEIKFLPPDREGRKQILEIHAYRLKGDKQHKFAVEKADLEDLAKTSYGYVGADLRGVLGKSFARAQFISQTDKSRTLKDGNIKVIKEDLEYALKKVKPSAIRDMPFVEPSVTFKDFGGYGTHKEVLHNIVSGTKGAMVLLYGPKGTGKTRMGEALAGEFGYNFLVIRGPELESKWVGESKDRVKEMFERAEQLAPTILLLDEIDTFVEKRGWASHKGDQTGYIQSLLSKPVEGVYVVGTTNVPLQLNAAFLDRFPDKLYYPLPDQQTMKDIWAMYVDPKKVDIGAVVDANSKLSPRDIRDAHADIVKFGLPQETAMYVARVKDVPNNDDTEWEQVIERIGDSVTRYRQMRKIADSLYNGASAPPNAAKEPLKLDGDA